MYFLRLLLVESSVTVIFYMVFLMCSVVIINYYFGKNFFFPIKRKKLKIKIRTRRKRKINLETKHNIQYSVTLYKMKIFPFYQIISVHA